MTSCTERSHYFVDIENLCGQGRPSAVDVERVRARLNEVLPLGAGDLVTIGCNHGAVVEVYIGWTGPRYVVRSGENGADAALLEAIAEDATPDKVARVVIASGDGIFAQAAARLAGGGVQVHVVARRSALSARLRLAATCVHYLPEEDDAALAKEVA